MVDSAQRLEPSSASGIGARIWLDGPYGTLSVDPSNYSHVVAICGGIGLTPYVELLERLARKGAEAPHIWLLWTVRDTAVREHFAECLQRLASLGVTVTVHSTTVSNDCVNSLHSEPDQPSVVWKSGRPAVEDTIGNTVAHYADGHHSHPNSARAGVAVLACGPSRLMKAVNMAAKNVGRHRGSPPIDLHHEVFSW